MDQSFHRYTQPLPIEEARREFPATSDFIYMDVANQGLISKTTRTSFDAHLDLRLAGVNDEHSQLHNVELTRGRFATFIGAASDEVAITKNASEGINIIANAIEWRAGDNVVLCPKLEHANNVLPWLQIKARHGVEVRTIEPENGMLPVGAVTKALDERTRVVALATVTMVPGFRTETAPIAEACRSKGAFLLADGTQSVGILATDVSALGVDGLAVSTVKGLMGLYGSGFLYCRRDWAERLTPTYLGRFSVDLGDAPESAPIEQVFKMRTGAARFDVGHYNFPGLIAADASIRQLSDFGITSIDRSVRELAARLAAGLHDLGLPVAGGRPGTHTGSIVAVGDMSGLGGAASDINIGSLQAYLAERKVIVSARRGMLRFSLHLYNTADEVDHVIDLARRWKKAPA
ncbi:putative cysteine desulfurase [Mesorhizobium metallidurans STM 2683]|uniref:Putative cysteine desulfurase n=1 Tax=Mesorhizobium metallidurans STM 2683 TaxID=1297569 RepID=M5EW69_9HYPH|nr:aminotransferase class V-fold PLP-dependent enzyme [Mesorhizobium metallidurans]CCV09264.1 putative cysteine desulfurase [Mesorhizobium metallidurans STM 2683]